MRIETYRNILNKRGRIYLKVNEIKRNPTIYLIKKIWSNSLFFIIFSFLNISLPIYICLISANIDQYGSYAAMGIGFVTTFQMAFSQVGFSFAIFSSIFFFMIAKNKNRLFATTGYDMIYDMLFLAFLYGLIITPIYIGSSYVYTKYANAHYNTIDSLPYAYDFIYSSAGYTFLITILYSLIITIHNNKGRAQGIFYMVLSFTFIVLLSLVLGMFTNLKGIGVGLGMTLGVIISILITFLISFFTTNVFQGIKFQIKKTYLFLILNYTWRPSLTTLSIQVFKGCALLLLSYQIPDALVNAVPLDYQMSRIIWYNLMYLIPFLLLGMADSIYFFFIKEDEEKILQGVNIHFALIAIGLILLVLTVILTVIGNELVIWLSKEYTKNQDKTYDENTIIANLELMGKDKIIDYVNSTLSLTDAQKEWIINLIKDLPSNVVNEVIKSTLLPKFTGFDPNNIQKILIFPNSFTYFYLSFYCILYPLGQFMNGYSLAISKEKPKTILLVVVQALAILFVVEFGVNYQETQKFYLMEAWSFPLLIIGIVAIVYLSFTSFLILDKYNRKKIRYTNHKLMI